MNEVEALERMKKLQDEFPHVVTQVQGTGLLFAVEIDPKVAKV